MQKMQVSHCNHTPVTAVQTPAVKVGYTGSVTNSQRENYVVGRE